MPDGQSDTFYEFQQNTKGVNGILTAVRKHSSELCDEEISIPLHLVFIDGDHSYLAVKRDFAKIASWLADDGVIAFHDCKAYEGVSRVIGEALSNGEWMILGCVENLLWLGRAKFTQ